MLDESLLREQPQSLPQRRTADAEVTADLLLDDLLAGRKLTAQDRVADAMRGEFDERRGELVPGAVQPWSGHGGQW